MPHNIYIYTYIHTHIHIHGGKAYTSTHYRTITKVLVHAPLLGLRFVVFGVQSLWFRE